MDPLVRAMRAKTILSRVTTGLVSPPLVTSLTQLGYEGAYQTWCDIKNLHAEARLISYTYSLSYEGEDGWRILPVSLIVPKATALRHVKAKFATKMEEINAAIKVIELDNPTKAASARSIVSVYSLGYKFRDHHRSSFGQVPETLADALRHSMMLEQREVAVAAIADTTARLKGPLLHFANRLDSLMERLDGLASGKNVGRLGSLRDTAVTNVQTLIVRLPELNFSDDIVIATAREKLLPILGNTPGQFRAGTREELSSYRDMAVATLEYLAAEGALSNASGDQPA